MLGIGTFGLLAALVATPALLAQQQGGGGQRQGQQGGTQRQALQGAESLVGHPAPAFNLKDFEGKAHALQDYRGKVVILEWIDPTNDMWVQKLNDPTCKAEFERYKTQGVVFLPIFAFTGNQGAQGMQGGQAGQNIAMSPVKPLDEQHAIEVCTALKRDHDIDFPILLDNGGRVTQLYKVERLPQAVIVDKQGVVSYTCGATEFLHALDRAISGQSTLPASTPRETEQERMRRQQEEQRRR